MKWRSVISWWGHGAGLRPNAPRLHCADRAGGGDDLIGGARQYIGAQMEPCQDRATPASTPTQPPPAPAPLKNLGASRARRHHPQPPPPPQPPNIYPLL